MNSKLIHSPLTSLIVDDDILAHNDIKQRLAEIDWMDEPKSCLNPVKAIDMILSFKPDIIFLDIEMPHLSGTELLDILGPTSSAVIMTTAHRHYTFQAYEYQVHGFLEKPIKLRPLLRAISKVRLDHIVNTSAVMDSTSPQASSPQTDDHTLLSPENTAAGKNAIQADFSKTKMWIRDKESIIPIDYKHLYMIKSNGSYVELFTNMQVYLIRKGIKKLLDTLPDYFIQTHRSYIVNSEFIIKLSDDTVLLSECKENAKISKRFRRKVYNKLGHIHG
ncbi:MAG TPA: LytTR family DNA-binding domain-containing protein [Dyadobacter sp.]|jgi:DNA-binding LytR/AlgR family response regulator|nr:LytTR family DNA-binding domain-containing protein [Dyadobacter sp.]